MENNISDNFYLYGKTSNLTAEGKEIIIYLKINEKASMLVRSLEGIFFSKVPLEKYEGEISDTERYTLKRDEMKEFENKYSGRFFAFEE